MKHRFAHTVACLLLSALTIHGLADAQDAQSIARNYYRYQKERIIDHVVPQRYENFQKLFADMDTLPFILFGRTTAKLVRSDTLHLNGDIHKMELFDLDNDGVADEFHILTVEGKPSQDFGFLYDLNRDKLVDYIVFWGGLAFTHEQEFYKYTYHMVDENYDGIVDLQTSSVVNQPGDSLPDPHFVLLVRDNNKDGAVEEVSFMHLPEGTTRPLATQNGRWYYETIFGRKEIDPANRQYFIFDNRLLSKCIKF